MTDPDWIAVDWGTTHLRGWAMADDGSVLASATSDRGMGQLAPSEFEPALLDLIKDWRTDVPVIACGMVGSRQGWVEAPYAAVPSPPLGAGRAVAMTQTPGLSVHVIPGLKQLDPADVMRGEETQIAGFLAMNPGWDGVLCLPGTHTKWAHVSAGEVVSFQTFMTGDLFAAISGHTVLRHSVGGDGWDEGAFDAALSDAMAHPARLAARMFSLRADGLLHGLGAPEARARLSALLIGAELAAARPYWLGQNIGVIGAGSLAALYIRALAAQGAPAVQANGTAVTIAGLIAARNRIKETS
ncbi:2-dehydro-3-deoxygalactonokinase [Roseisalinus antarcticus]|uniref:2-keto-3-deoxy-galactonokinase n=1 Tax=Roseisalinus antarcticus TaxID=254357 RepID=A0A1Y5RTG7_9RHOB|nr:2-dehydro-3-deoxygalactonokinase [Roseisalinus antarcticus]SLN24635.1 2-keto-3-deoxy-galactonokinase [Roseisalinus antarcticus]